MTKSMSRILRLWLTSSPVPLTGRTKLTGHSVEISVEFQTSVPFSSSSANLKDD